VQVHARRRRHGPRPSGRPAPTTSVKARIRLDVDRLTRDNRDLEDTIDVVVRAYRPILDRRGSLDLLTEQGRTNARVIVSFKADQSADTAWRMENKHRALQREGIAACYLTSCTATLPKPRSSLASDDAWKEEISPG
jgi:site-specific DNA recombinase